MKPISLRFILKNGSEFTVKCTAYDLEYSRMLERLCACDFQGVIENKPVFVNLSEVAAVIRLVQEELEGGDEE